MRLRTTPTALGLYGTLLVLPTLVFGWLYWCELVDDHEEQLASVPDDARDAARRIVDGMAVRLRALLDEETARPFTHYARQHSPEEAVGDEIIRAHSPLISHPRPEGIEGWFSFDLHEKSLRRDIDVFLGKPDRGPTLEDEDAFRRIVENLRTRRLLEPADMHMSRLGIPRTISMPLTSVAFHAVYETNFDCLKSCSELMKGLTIDLAVTEFQLEFYLQDGIHPRAVATRRVVSRSGLKDIPASADCLYPLLADGISLLQGFFIDTNWLCLDLPFDVSGHILDEHETITVAGSRSEPCPACAQIFPIRDLGFETLDETDAYTHELLVSVDAEKIRERFHNQSQRFLLVALMLVVTLGAGMMLLYRSVRRELDHARRMQNFVSAVTHELRTPISTIRLHGEMLLDGWMKEPEKQTEYYRRIVRETGRLSTLVERVLEKGRLTEGSSMSEPRPGSLNDAIESLIEDLAPAEGEPSDVAYELEDGLPDVWIVPEAVEGILSNLVENARKYAPVTPEGEPIRVRTSARGRQVLLQVMDRGPGVPAEERERIFEAFYRLGSETTRTTTGTGLGLHLVHLFAQSTRARVSYEPRPGGGSIFQVVFERAA